ncbi:MAG: cation diffusion facilitator family transporter, partial [Halobacteriota archaeon]|nr:cation diffusion facilitator family transporter [Halobacteriota archaeon]
MFGFKKITLIPDYGDPTNPNTRARYAYLEATVSIAGNFMLFLLKLILGMTINSIALIADSIHTLSDVGTSLMVILGFNISKRPSDEAHPFGYGRVEYIMTLIIAISLILVGCGFVVQSMGRILEVVPISNLELVPLTGIIIAVTAIEKEMMARFSMALGRKIKSDVLIADAWHHRSDAFTNIIVGIGIIGSVIGYPILDPIFGIIVSTAIIYVGVDLVRTSSSFLIGKAPDMDIVRKIEDISSSIGGVYGIHDITVHDYGTQKTVSLHTDVENDLTLNEAHEITDSIEEVIQKEMGYSAVVQLDPKEMHKDVDLAREIIGEILDGEEEIISYHKIKITRIGEKEEVKVHLMVDKNMSV